MDNGQMFGSFLIGSMVMVYLLFGVWMAQRVELNFKLKVLEETPKAVRVITRLFTIFFWLPMSIIRSLIDFVYWLLS